MVKEATEKLSMIGYKGSRPSRRVARSDLVGCWMVGSSLLV